MHMQKLFPSCWKCSQATKKQRRKRWKDLAKLKQSLDGFYNWHFFLFFPSRIQFLKWLHLKKKKGRHFLQIRQFVDEEKTANSPDKIGLIKEKKEGPVCVGVSQCQLKKDVIWLSSSIYYANLHQCLPLFLLIQSSYRHQILLYEGKGSLTTKKLKKKSA